MEIKTTVEFKSDKFLPFLPEDSQVNPGVYGAELAFWFAEQLAKRDVITSYPNFEDWGWFIEYITETDDEYWFCVSSVTGTANEWRCFLDPKKKSLFGKRADLQGAQALLTGIKEVLEAENSVTEINWYIE